MNFERIKSQESVFRKAEVVDIPVIKDLLEKTLEKNLTDEEKKDGFVTYEPSDEELNSFIDDTGIFLSLKGNDLKGYFITASSELGRNIPFFKEMIFKMEQVEYDGKLLSDYKFCFLIQINVSKKYRKGPTFFRLHTYAQTSLKDKGFELGIGEVNDTNKNSLSVHANLVDVGTYNSHNGSIWHILVSDLRED